MIAFHTLLGFLALGTGLGVVLMQKGTRSHVLIGRAYAASMYGLCLTSVFIPSQWPLLGPYGVFHVFAAWGTLQLTAGLVPVLWRRRFQHGYRWHRKNMLWSYVGLTMATGSHFIPYLLRYLAENTALSGTAAWLAAAGLFWGVPVVLGVWTIEQRPGAVKA